MSTTLGTVEPPSRTGPRVPPLQSVSRACVPLTNNSCSKVCGEGQHPFPFPHRLVLFPLHVNGNDSVSVAVQDGCASKGQKTSFLHNLLPQLLGKGPSLPLTSQSAPASCNVSPKACSTTYLLPGTGPCYPHSPMISPASEFAQWPPPASRVARRQVWFVGNLGNTVYISQTTLSTPSRSRCLQPLDQTSHTLRESVLWDLALPLPKKALLYQRLKIKPYH